MVYDLALLFVGLAVGAALAICGVFSLVIAASRAAGREAHAVAVRTMPSIAANDDHRPPDPAKERELEREFRLAGGYGARGKPPGDTLTLTQPPAAKAAPRPCKPCSQLRAALKDLKKYFF